jgi:fibronectin type 3 domain-containing protein
MKLSCRTWACAVCQALLVLAPATPAEQQPDWATHPENRWVKQSPRAGAPAPAFGWEGSGDFDPHHRKWIHFGGHDGIPQGFPLFTYDLDTGRWRQRFPNTSPPGCCCVDGANVFDVANRRFVRFPGAALGHGYQWSRGVKLKSSPVWLYDVETNTWTNMRPPPYHQFLPREGLGSLNAGATYDANHELALSFGGQGSAGGTNNLFAYDAYANALYRLKAANSPSPRDGMGLCYDTKNDCLVLFGSQYASDEKTWIYRYATNRWEGHDLTPRPVGKKLGTYSTIPRMAYDSVNGVCLCLTWDTKTNEHETWAFDAGKLAWAKMNPKAEPSPSMSRSRNLGYSARDNVFILETSSKDGRGRAPQIWTYRLKNAPAKAPPAPPSDLRVVTDEGTAALTWSASPSAKEYRVYRARAAEPWKARFEKLASVTGTTYTDRGLSAGAVYFYTVRAVDGDGCESRNSPRARTQPRVLPAPVVSMLAEGKVEVSWKAHSAADVMGYNVYRGEARVRAVKKGTPGAWKDNDPEYSEPLPVEVRDIQRIRKLNAKPIAGTIFADQVDLKGAEEGPERYRFAVYAYIVRAVNKLGVESGPSPYVLTIPSEPTNVLNREAGGKAQLLWDASPEKGVIGYHVYKLEGTWKIVRVTAQPVKTTTFTHEGGKGVTRYWVVAVDALGQEGQPSSPVWHNQSYKGFYSGEWHQ